MQRSDLLATLERIDGRGYPAYKDLAGPHALPGGTLFVDHVQGDPFAAPSKLRFRLAMEDARLPDDLLETRERRMALADFLARCAATALARSARGSSGRGEGSGRSGEIHVDAGGQEVLERSAVWITDAFVELRLEVGLPARGRRILGRAAARLLAEAVPAGARMGLCWDAIDRDAARAFVACVENQEAIRRQLPSLGLVAFVGDGSLLPRESGASDRPLQAAEVVRFWSPPELAVRIPVPHPVTGSGSGDGSVLGLGIPKGVTLVVGGGYHGKSTLLRALERGVYPHIPGDGRETVVSDPALVKIRAEDGRRVAAVDIHGFVDRLPGGRDTHCFSSEDASGSTSQAASIVEAVEAGARGLLLDEDSCATNFMVRDARMQALVAREHEPITPFVDRVRELYERHGVSSILVMGGSGDYFEVADRVIAMRDYRPLEVSAEAARIAAALPSGRARELREPLAWTSARRPDPRSIDPSRGRHAVRIDTRARDLVVYGRTRLELRALEQLVDTSQTRAVAEAIHLASRLLSEELPEDAALPDVLDALEARLDETGLGALCRFQSARETGAHPGNLARPRRFEIAAALNRLRGVDWRSVDRS